MFLNSRLFIHLLFSQLQAHVVTTPGCVYTAAHPTATTERHGITQSELCARRADHAPFVSCTPVGELNSVIHAVLVDPADRASPLSLEVELLQSVSIIYLLESVVVMLAHEQALLMLSPAVRNILSLADVYLPSRNACDFINSTA